MEIGPVLAAALIADEADRALLATETAPALVERLLELAEGQSLNALLPASSAGERLAGALMLHAGGRLRLWDFVTAERVLVLDGLVASLVGLRRSMDLATGRGAVSVHGVAVVAGLAEQAAWEATDLTLLSQRGRRSAAA